MAETRELDYECRCLGNLDNIPCVHLALHIARKQRDRLLAIVAKCAEVIAKAEVAVSIRGGAIVGNEKRIAEDRHRLDVALTVLTRADHATLQAARSGLTASAAIERAEAGGARG